MVPTSGVSVEVSVLEPAVLLIVASLGLGSWRLRLQLPRRTRGMP
jgi:hypothetical protein